MSDNYEVPRGERPAVAAPPDLHARYEADAGAYATSRVYAFSAEGHPLVLGFGSTRLVRLEVAETKMTYVGVQAPFGPPLAGPFTPAPAFDDNDRLLLLIPLVEAVDGKIDALTSGQEALRSQFAELNGKIDRQHADATARLDLVLGFLGSAGEPPAV